MKSGKQHLPFYEGEAPSGCACGGGDASPDNCRHGGNIYAASRRTGIPERKIIDFSASINPLGVPRRAALLMRKAITRLYHYPEPFSESLCAHLAGTLGVKPDSIICGNGSTELIYLIPRVLRPTTVLVTAPTFAEYSMACRNSGAAHVVAFPLKCEEDFDIDPDAFIGALSDADLAFLCNPNNPTGRLTARTDMLRIADAARRFRCYLVVDEAFIDFCSHESVLPEVDDNPYLIVLRSMTKMFALSGVRLGYAILHPSLTEAIKAYKEPWTVNSIAQTAGITVLEDKDYQKASLDTMKEEKSFMEEGFRKLGISFIPSRANYYLLRLEKAQEIMIALEQKGILIRDCSNFAGLDNTYVRVAVRTRRENRILLKEMAHICARL